MTWLASGWNWITEHATVLSAVVSAAATGVVAWFTIRLTGATKGQLTKLTETLALARSEFIATHRPRLRVRLLTLRPLVAGEPLIFEFSISNVGDSPAMKVTYNLYFRMPDINGAGEIHWSGNGEGHFVEIAAGAQAPVTHQTDFICPESRFIDYTEGLLIVGGLIAYTDTNGVTRLTSFRRIAARKGTFQHTEPINPDFEYEA